MEPAVPFISVSGAKYRAGILSKKTRLVFLRSFGDKQRGGPETLAE
jgi:hypothetical protein